MVQWGWNSHGWLFAGVGRGHAQVVPPALDGGLGQPRQPLDASGGGVAPSLQPGSMGAVGTPGGEAGAIAGVSGGGNPAMAGRLLGLAPLPA